jgi:hypothetical protein
VRSNCLRFFPFGFTTLKLKVLKADPVDVPPPKTPLGSDGGMSPVSRSSQRWSLSIDSAEGSLESDRNASCQLMAGEGHLCSDHCHVLADGLHRRVPS